MRRDINLSLRERRGGGRFALLSWQRQYFFGGKISTVAEGNDRGESKIGSGHVIPLALRIHHSVTGRFADSMGWSSSYFDEGERNGGESLD